MNDDGDAISRAKAQRRQWAAERREAMALERFNRFTPTELIKMAESGRDLRGVALSQTDWMALDNAWHDAFGETLFKPDEPSSEDAANDNLAPAPRELPVESHPLMSVPDDTMLRPRDVRRMLGYARTTLKREIRSGKFPQPQRLVPHKIHIGWPARQLKAWLKLTTRGDNASLS